MEGLSSFLPPSFIQCQTTGNYATLYQFCEYICSAQSRLGEIDYWSPVNRFLCLIECSHRFLNSISGFHFTFDIDPLLKCCTKMLDFCISFLDLITKNEVSVSRQVCIYLITSFLRGLYEIDGFLTPHILTIAQEVIDIEYYSIPKLSHSESHGFKATLLSAQHKTILPSFIVTRPYDDLQFGDSSKLSASIDFNFREFIFQLSSHHLANPGNFDSLPSCSIKAAVISHNLHHFSMNTSSSILLSAVSTFLGASSLKNPNIFKIIHSNNILDIVFHEVLSLLDILSLQKVFDSSQHSIDLLSNACYSTLNTVLSDQIYNSTIQGNHKPPFFLKFTYSKLIKLSLEVCDRFTALLHISNQPRFAAGNFKLFQTCLILRKLDVSDPNITTGKTNKSAHIGLSPQTIEIVNWILSSIRNIISDLDQYSSQPCDSFPFQEPNIFLSSTPHTRFAYLINQAPLMPILFNFLINSYANSFAAFICSSIYEYNHSIWKDHVLAISKNEDIAFFNTLGESLTFLFTQNTTFSDEFPSFLANISFQIKSVVNSVKDLFSSANHEGFTFNRTFYDSNHCLSYYINLLSNSDDCFTAIPPPPPNIPLYNESLSLQKRTCPYSFFYQLNLLLGSESYISFSHSDLFPCFLQLSRDILIFLRDAFISSHDVCRQYLLQELTFTHVSAFCFFIREINDCFTRDKLLIPKEYPLFFQDFLGTMHYFLFSGLFGNSLQIYFMENIGLSFSKWPLFLSESLLFILSRMLFYHAKFPITSNDHFLLRICNAFIDTFERNIVSSSTLPDEDVDLNFLHFQLLLFSFSFVPLVYKKSLFYRVVLLIHDSLKNKVSTLSSLIVVSRLVLLFEYFLFFFTNPSKSLYDCISSCFSENSSVSLPENISTSTLEQSLKLFLMNQNNVLNQPLLATLPRFYYIYDRSSNEIKIDKNFLLALNQMYLHIPLTYSEFYFDLLNLTFNIDCFTESNSSLNNTLVSFYINYRYESLCNILLYVPCMRLQPIDVALSSAPLEFYASLFINLQTQHLTKKDHLTGTIIDMFLLEERSIEESYASYISLVNLLYRPIDIIHLADSFFSNVIASNTLSEFHLLLLITTFVSLLYENLLTLENLSFSAILKTNVSSNTQIDDQNNKYDIDQNAEYEHAPHDTRPNMKMLLNNPDVKHLEHSEPGASMKLLLLQDLSFKFIPKILSVLKILAESCSNYLLINSSKFPEISKTLLDICTVLSSSKDLTLFPHSCSIPLFDTCLSDSDSAVFNYFQQVSLSCFDVLSFPGDGFLKKRHSMSAILERYLYSLTLNQTNCLSPIYKHCISSTTSLIKCLFKWCRDPDFLDGYSLELSSFVHSAPFISLAPGCSLDQVIPKHLFGSICNASTFDLLKNSYRLIHNPDLRYFCNANNVLRIYYSIILRCVKDSKLNRILCETVVVEEYLNFFVPFFLPIYPEYRLCLTSSIHAFADTLIYQKENPIEESNVLISQLNEGAFLDQVRIFTWFNYAMLGYPGEDEKSIEERCDKLLVLANAISTGGTILNPSTCQFMLITILPLGSKLLDYIQLLLLKSKTGKELDAGQKIQFLNSHAHEFPPLSYSHPCLNSFLPIITGLAEVHNVNGELQILKAVSLWLPRCKELVLNYISCKSDFVYDEFLSDFGASCSFLSDLLEQIKLISTVVKILMSRDGLDSVMVNSLSVIEDVDSYLDIQHSEDEECDSSTFIDDDRLLNARVCTSTLQKDEFKQHWYHCHSCKLLELNGICSTCAKVCHRGHDLSYVLCSPIKCHCGSNGSNNCICFSARRGVNIPNCYEDLPNTVLDNRKYFSTMFSSPACEKSFNSSSKTHAQFDPELIRLVEAIEGEPGLREELYGALDFLDISKHSLDILDALTNINTRFAYFSPIRAPNHSIVALLHKLHCFSKTIEYSEALGQFNLRSPEGSFDNVKLTSSEDTYPNLESLLTSFSVNRNSLCTINGCDNGSGQYLLVSMDKGRFTTLNRSTLFKPESTNKKKITINKIENMIAPFNILTMCSNPFCEEFLAICGIKECNVYTLSPIGSFTGKNLSVQVGIESKNYIIKCFWLPISKTILAVVTAQFVKIFDLSIDSISPLYYFCVRSDHIVDSTFISTSNTLLLIIITHNGELLYQSVNSRYMAEHGPVYISSKFEVILSEDIWDQSTRKVGASVYFSHCLQLLFFSYTQGINLVSSFEQDYSVLKNTIPIIYKGSKTPVTLYQWTESYLQPGLICALSQCNISPVVIFLLSNTFYIYDFKADSNKSKVQGIVLNVNVKNFSVEGRTSLILLYEDGSLRIHCIKTDKILFWQTFNFMNSSPLQHFRSKRKSKSLLNNSAPLSLPVDIFETCSLCEEIEFGGNDILHVYNQSQIKNRLSSEFLYLFNSKVNGFNIEIISTNSNNVFVGVQIQLGCNSILQSPSYVELFNRRVPIEFVNDKARWFDIPFSQDEIIGSINKFVLKFGPSKDANSFNYVDSIKVYSKTKEEFGFSGLVDSDQFTTKSQIPSQISQIEEFLEPHAEGNKNETELERVTNLSLTLLCESGPISIEKRNHALNIVTQLLLCSLDKPIKAQCKSLLHQLHSTPQDYFFHIDEAICNYIVARLYLTHEGSLSPELYQQLILNLHSIALARPLNIARLQDISYLRKCCEDFRASNPRLEMISFQNLTNLTTFMDKIVSLFWSFLRKRPYSSSLAPIGSPGLLYVKETVTIITGIIYSLLQNDVSILPSVVENIFVFMKCDDVSIWESCLSTLCVLLRPRIFLTSNQQNTCNIPFKPLSTSSELLTSSYDQDKETEACISVPQESLMDANFVCTGESFQDNVTTHEIPLTHPHENDYSCMESNPMEVILSDQEILAELGISQNHDIDDDSIMNLALAISLQDPTINTFGGDDQMSNINISEVGFDSSQLPKNLAIDIVHNSQSSAISTSDTMTVDEHEQSGDQSSTGTLTPPSKFSGPGEIHNPNDDNSQCVANFEELSSDQAGDSSPDEVEPCSAQNPFSASEELSQETADDLKRNNATQFNIDISPDKDKLLSLNTSLIFVLVRRLPEIMELGGIKAIHYMQLFLTLMSGLNFLDTIERPIYAIIHACLMVIRMDREDISDLLLRSPENEVVLILMKFLSVLLIREKKEDKPTRTEPDGITSAWNIIVYMISKGALCLDFCLKIFKRILAKSNTEKRDVSPLNSLILVPTTTFTSPTDLLPFFVKQNAREKDDIFLDYEKILIETIMRLPCQLKRICDLHNNMATLEFGSEWFSYLSEYMIITTQTQGVGRKSVRKLLLNLAGSREGYRRLRDLHVFGSNLKKIFHLSDNSAFCSRNQGVSFNFDYDCQIIILHNISMCMECGINRPENWQDYCLQNTSTIPYLLLIASSLHEEIAGNILRLVCYAICGFEFKSDKTFTNNFPIVYPVIQPVEHKSSLQESSKHLVPSELLINLLFQYPECIVLNKYYSLYGLLTYFLLETNSLTLRQQSQAFIWTIYTVCSQEQKKLFLQQFWSMFELALTFGQKAAQFVELLSHCSMAASPLQLQESGYLFLAFQLLKRLNEIIFFHPNSHVYQILSTIVELDGYFLESEPCLICNNPEISNSNLKLLSIKSDSKYTSISGIFKLINTYNIASINLKINDLKRQKMVKTICIYYSNKVFHSAVDLKNNKELWHKAKEVGLHAGQHEIKIHFVLPINCCNLIIEYSDFFESAQSALESLQCPRCSAPVPAHPGICGNCSENVYQCHKCRAINYDEKDPFLCNACGYSKYGKFDYSLAAKVYPSVEPINNEEERKKMVLSMTNLLEKADQVYKQLISHRQALDVLLTNGNYDFSSTTIKSKGEGVIIGINKYIYSITHRYCNDCKSTFNELSKIIQGILATRHELVTYDIQHLNTCEQSFLKTPFLSETHYHQDFSKFMDQTKCLDLFSNFGKCYGCIALASKQCIFLLKNLAAISSHKICLIHLGLLTELCNINLRIGTSSMQNDVRSLILTLNHDNANANIQLMNWLKHKLTHLIKQHHSHPNFGLAVHHEVQLMISTMEYNDIGWEERLRCLLMIFFNSTRHSTPVIFEYITLPFLKVILQLMDINPMLSSKFKAMVPSDICTNSHRCNNIFIVLSIWLGRCPLNTFNHWKNGKCDSFGMNLIKQTWLKKMLFHSSSQFVRCTASSLFLFLMKDCQRQKFFIDLLISYLVEVPIFGEVANEYLDLLKMVIADEKWRVYLSSDSVLLLLGQIISAEVSKLSSLEDSTIKVDVSLGYTLKILSLILFQLMCPQLTEKSTEVQNQDIKFGVPSTSILSLNENIQLTQYQVKPEFLKDNIFDATKLKLLPLVLDVFLSLKRLVIQRTKRVDDAQESIMELLNMMSSGSLLDKQEFMVICIDTLSKFPPTDVRTPVVIFEELCSVILPDESEAIDFDISLEKDPQQEEFLQGRMQNNPYAASDPTIGPLMRDVKNKICRDTELLALLEEDTGMELLVCNKIISLDLNVNDVYQRLWLLSQPTSAHVMRIVYRMRGLLGEATEDMVDTFAKGEEEINDEEKFQAASVMSDCGGLEAILFRLKCLQNPLHSVNLLFISLKLLSHCVKLQINRKYLLKSSLNTIDTLLSLFTNSLPIEEDSEGTIGNFTLEILLEILLKILHEASALSFLRIDSKKLIEEKVHGDANHLNKLLSCINNPYVQKNTDILKRIMKLIPFLTYGDITSMQNILDHFSKYLAFDSFDNDPSSEHSLYLDCFCNITEEISYDESGITLRDMILDSGLVIDAIKYIELHTPPFIFVNGNDEWEIFLNKPSLEYILRFLTGVSVNHTNSQRLLGDIILQLHYTEKATTIRGIGSLAENLLDSLNTNEVIFVEVVRTREETKSKRIQEAQAFQERSLQELGITISDGKVKMKFLEEVHSLKEESGLTCCICMEGYDSHPRKILGIYSFAKCCIMDDYENKPRKTQGYCCVSGFSIVHLDCHNTAIRASRQTRGKEEWEAASIHNSNIRCNSIMPVWGPEVQDNGYYSCLAKYHSSLQDATGCRDPNFWSSLHNIQIILMIFGTGNSFSDECGGGSKLSNMRFLCYLISYSFYLLQSSGSFHKESHNLIEFMARPSTQWVSSVYDLDSPVYFLVASLFLMSGFEWMEKRSHFLERVIITSHSRFHSNTVISSYTSLDELEYCIYKPYLVVFALVDRIQRILKNIDALDKEEMLSNIIHEYKTSDRGLLLKFENLMDYYEEELFPAESFAEYCDVINLLKVNESPDKLLSKYLAAPFKH